MSLNWPQYELEAQWKVPIKKKQRKKSEMAIAKDNAE
jgi:hypothetical protein